MFSCEFHVNLFYRTPLAAAPERVRVKRFCCFFKGAAKLKLQIIFVSVTKIGENITRILDYFATLMKLTIYI